MSYEPANHSILNLRFLLIDSELSVLNEVYKKILPEVKILFCHFHFVKNTVKAYKKDCYFDPLFYASYFLLNNISRLIFG